MDSFNYDNLKLLRVNAPKGMYEQVQERLKQDRIRIAKTRRHLAFGIALLLLMGVVNITTAIYSDKKEPFAANDNTEQVLFETYFDNQILPLI
jgi:translation elongation factor EF-1beta